MEETPNAEGTPDSIPASLEDVEIMAFLAAVEALEAFQAQDDPDAYLAAMQEVIACYDALSEEQAALLETTRPEEEGTYAEMVEDLVAEVNALTESMESPAACDEHMWDDGLVTKEANLQHAGEKTFTCKVCNSTRIEKLPRYNGTYPLSVSTSLNNEFNKGDPITVSDLPENFSVTVTVTYCNEDGDVTHDEKILTVANAASVNPQGTKVTWENVFQLPEWVCYRTEPGDTTSEDDFDPKYITKIEIVEANFHVGRYTCTTVTNGGFKGEKGDETADPYIWTMQDGIEIRSTPLGSFLTSKGATLVNTYRSIGDNDLKKVAVKFVCDENEAHSQTPTQNPIKYQLKAGYEPSGYLRLSQNEEGNWLISVDAKKWLTTYNKYVMNNHIADSAHELVTTEPETVAFTWDGQSWVPDKSEIVIRVSDPVVAAKIGDTNYPTLQAAIDAAQENETVVLLKDVTENVTATNKTITLDLADHKVDGDSKGTVLTIKGGNVTLTGDGTITGGNATAFPNGGGVTVTDGGDFTMESGTITNNTAKHNGGGVFVYNGKFTMNGGTISENNGGNYGGGV